MSSPMLPQLRDEVWRANQALVRAGLVTLSFGNASGVDRTAGVFLIKPSGLPYERLRPEDLVAVSLADGSVVEGDLRPSSDTPTHLLLYRRFRINRRGGAHALDSGIGMGPGGTCHPAAGDDPRRPLPWPGAGDQAAPPG